MMTENDKTIYTKEYVEAQAAKMAKEAGVDKITISNLQEEMTKEDYEYCMGIVKQAIAASKKFREYVEHKRKYPPNLMDYEPEFNDSIIAISNGKQEEPGKKIIYMHDITVNDKNGKDIYEGHIINDYLDADNTVQYLFVTFDTEEAVFGADSPSLQDISRHSEVIGNKYENSEAFKELLDRYQEKINEAEHAILPICDIDNGDGELNDAISTTRINISRANQRLKELRKDSI